MSALDDMSIMAARAPRPYPSGVEWIGYRPGRTPRGRVAADIAMQDKYRDGWSFGAEVKTLRVVRAWMIRCCIVQPDGWKTFHTFEVPRALFPHATRAWRVEYRPGSES